MNILNKFKNIFYHPKINREAFVAYFDKLPDQIEVNWKRDGDFIIGEIDAEGNKFMTQAKSAKEFVEMVNDALFVTYQIPEEYFDALSPKRFLPPPEQFMALNDMSVKKSKMSIQKGQVVVA